MSLLGRIVVGLWTLVWTALLMFAIVANIVEGMPLICDSVFLLMAAPGWIILFVNSTPSRNNGPQLTYEVYDHPALPPPPGKASPNSTRLYSPPPLD